jgi:hypothetical protein
MRIKSRRSVKSVLAAITGLGLVFALPAFAATGPDAHKEIQTAEQHARFAVQAKDVKHVHLHLHHVINCLVGANGEDFDATAGDPCKSMGDGALKDVSGNDAAEGLLNQSLSLAKVGVAIGDHRAARSVAIATEDLLRLAAKDTAKHGK